MVVVGIENTERRQDMTRPTMNEEDKKIAPRVGESAKFRAFIRDELMPEIDRRVRGNGETAIVGESLAGKALLRGAAARLLTGEHGRHPGRERRMRAHDIF